MRLDEINRPWPGQKKGEEAAEAFHGWFKDIAERTIGQLTAPGPTRLNLFYEETPTFRSMAIFAVVYAHSEELDGWSNTLTMFDDVDEARLQLRRLINLVERGPTLKQVDLQLVDVQTLPYLAGVSCTLDLDPDTVSNVATAFQGRLLSLSDRLEP